MPKAIQSPEKTRITAGMWTIDDGDTDAFGVFADDGNAICYLSADAAQGTGLRGREIDTANAHLIAAAPEMYDVLKNIDEHWSEDFDGPESPLALSRFTDRSIATWRSIRAAIVKAEGRNA